MVLCGNDILTADRAFIIVRDYDIPPADVRSVTPSTAMRRVQRVGGMLLNASRHTCRRPTRLPPAAAFLLRSSAGPVRPIQARVGKYTVLADHTCPVSSSPKPRTLHIHSYSLLTTRSTTHARQEPCTATRYRAYQTWTASEHTYQGCKAHLVSRLLFCALDSCDFISASSSILALWSQIVLTLPCSIDTLQIALLNATTFWPHRSRAYGQYALVPLHLS